MSDDSKRAGHIFKKWKVELASKDKSAAHVAGNFDELFYNLYAASVPFEVAESFLKDAIAAHMPSNAIAKATYHKPGFVTKKFKTEQEFITDWRQMIHDKAHQAFYAMYDIDGVEDKEEKQFGNMSAREYRLQRKYADSFPTLNIADLQKRMEEVMKENPDDVEVGNVDDEA